MHASAMILRTLCVPKSKVAMIDTPIQNQYLIMVQENNTLTGGYA